MFILWQLGSAFLWGRIPSTQSRWLKNFNIKFNFSIVFTETMERVADAARDKMWDLVWVHNSVWNNKKKFSFQGINILVDIQSESQCSVNLVPTEVHNFPNQIGKASFLSGPSSNLLSLLFRAIIVYLCSSYLRTLWNHDLIDQASNLNALFHWNILWVWSQNAKFFISIDIQVKRIAGCPLARY